MTEPDPLSPGARMLANRLRKNEKRLRSWRQRADVTCYRVYDADIPEYAAAIDLYQEAGPAPRTFAHIQEYRAPASIPEPLARERLQELQAAVCVAFGLESAQLAVKTRSRGRGGSKYGRLADRGEFLWVREGAAELQVNLFDYLDTGLFLDHRPLRRRVAAEAAGSRFLNLFCYTGSVTVHALRGGARRTVSVDLSATYLNWADRNLRRNGATGTDHRLIQGDVLDWLAEDRDHYELIFCDPPTFSNSKRAADFDLQRQHVALLRLAMARLEPGGVLLFSNNFRRFSLDDQALGEFAAVREISRATLDPDFARDPKVHRCWELRHPQT